MFEKAPNTAKSEEATLEKKKGNWHPRELSKALAVVASLMPTETAPGTIESINDRDWASGVELLQENVNHGTHEVAALFYMNEAGKGNWQSFGIPQGSTQVDINLSDWYASHRAYEEANGKAERVCFTHTHPVGAILDYPLAASEQISTLVDQKKIFATPSTLDLMMIPKSQFISDDISHLVFDMSGGWYMRAANEADFKDSEAVAKFAERQLSLRDELFGTDETAGSLAEGLEKLSDQDIAALLQEMGGKAQKWSDMDERSERELSILGIINELLAKDAEGTFIHPHLVKIGPEVINTYTEMQLLRQQGELLYEYVRTYAILGNLKAAPEEKMAIKHQEILEDLRPVYIEQYKDIFGHEPQLEGELEELLIEGLLLNGVKGRFASYSELSTEPPCAGPDYEPAAEKRP